MKSIIVILSFLIISCGSIKYPFVPPPAPQPTLVDVANEVRANVDSNGFWFHGGKNDSLYGALFLYAVKKHNIMQPQDIDNMCLALDSSYRESHYDASPTNPECWSRDNFIGVARVLDEFRGSPCLKKHLDNMIRMNKRNDSLCGESAWAPQHTSFFNRLNLLDEGGAMNPFDFALYISSQAVCNTPADNTSDKLLIRHLITVGVKYYQNSWVTLAYKECEKVDYNYSLKVFYGENSPMYKLLKDIY